jgi:hypothetical protein
MIINKMLKVSFYGSKGNLLGGVWGSRNKKVNPHKLKVKMASNTQIAETLRTECPFGLWSLKEHSWISLCLTSTNLY